VISVRMFPDKSNKITSCRGSKIDILNISHPFLDRFKVLTLGGIHRFSPAMAVLERSSSLNYLNVSGNNIQTLSLKSFSAMPCLHTLVLDHNPISEVTGPVFQFMSQLQYLSLSQMPNLFYLDLSTFSGLVFCCVIHSMLQSQGRLFPFMSIVTFFIQKKMFRSLDNSIWTIHGTIQGHINLT
jgi:Leucine-rich repeat (LRR) protein